MKAAIRKFLRKWLESDLPHQGEMIITDRRPFTDGDVWMPFPIRDGQVESEW